MENFTFYNPTKILFGRNTISQIGNEIKASGVKSVLLLAGGGSIKHNGVYDTIVASLRANGIDFVEHFGVRPNPLVEHSNSGRALMQKHNLDGILAVGGGSVIDEGKSLASCYYLDNIWDAYEKKVVPDKGLPLFVVLTLSGTGTESNMNSVLSNAALQKKMTLYSPLHFPKVSIIDPSIQMSLPWHQTANGGIDAITHCMENYFTGTYQETTIGILESLMRTLIKSLDALQVSPNNYEDRANLAWAAVLALNGVSGAGMNGGDWATHKLQHGISALYPEVAHAPGLSALFPSWLRYNYKLNEPQFARWAKNVWHCDSIEKGIAAMELKFKSWGSPICIRELGCVAKERLGEIVENTLGIAPVIGGLKKLDRADIAKIYEMAW
ncbi:MAG: iron-containing alcohol dehydrogenase [Ignavibacteria bacterium]|jgi:alcohol dehydrogenase YqhD (iron-dependent ADH family)|nr:iron-containing alcohol dehydrogenase [Ignavibacteria bacterium]